MGGGRGGRLDADTRRWIAVLHCGPGAARGGRSALELLGLQHFEAPLLHVVVVRGARIRHLPDVVTHSTRTARPLPTAIRAEILGAAALRHRTTLLAVLDDIAGGSEALAEIDVVRLCRRHGLPSPDRQVRRRDSDGRTRYLDAQWTGADGRSVVVEVDGAVHLRPSVYADDMYRANDLGLSGDLVLRFTSAAVRLGDERIVIQLRRALGVPDRQAQSASQRTFCLATARGGGER